MQCPTCGSNTPGTLGTCSHCNAPIDVYSVGPAAPLAAPVGEVSADLGERTMMVPPPTPSWASGATPPMPMTPPADPAPPLAPSPAESVIPGIVEPASPAPGAPLGTPPPPMTPPGPAAGPSSTGTSGFAVPSAQSGPLSVPTPPADPAPAPAPAPGTLPPVDPESTAAWTFDPNEDDEPASASGTGGFAAPPPPAWSDGGQDGGQGGGFPSSGGFASSGGGYSTGAGFPSNGAGFGAGSQQEPESIVPDSWFAQPRKPQEADAAEATQVWAPQSPPAAQPWGGTPQGEATVMDGATQIAPGPGMPPADQGTRLDINGGFGQSSPMGALMGGPMAGPPMGAPMGQGMPPMGQMGPGDPAFGGYPPPPAPSGTGGSGGGPSKPLLIAVAALVTIAVAAVAFVAWPGGGGSSSAAKTTTPRPANTKVAQTNKIPSAAREQAAAMNAILVASGETRGILAGALGRARTCKTLPAAIQGFQTVAQRRQNQLRRNRELKLDKLSNGERLRGSLQQALQASLDVDQALLRWARANQRKCKGKPRPDAAHVPGRAAAERRATTAKRQFVNLWNPVARTTGQPQRGWQQV
ncbi:hypothetical protein [Actinomadura fibrosa]|uniref:Uncharacterized protein n=1 Tax=Actinomadura fibrosa TaxID=111802 RepID=A0ABW2XYW2_9ACTN|nr:hypothetical protein [Actinomadura fibrosa]